nr:T9SS type A sorting domain-containing protein [Polaribacter porphyrae]
MDGDGIVDLVVGARSDDDSATDAGAAYILFMNADGTVKANQKISALSGGFNETLLEKNYFGYGVAGIEDYNNDDIPDIAVSAPNSTNIALYIIHLNRDGTVKSYVKNTNFSSDYKFQIYNIIGKQIYESRITSQETNVDISNYASGLYFLVSKMNEEIKTFKIVKE